MALSQTSLEIDTLTVETLFNRGPLLSTSQAYVPVMSNIGGFSKWVNQPVSTIYYPFFGAYPKPDVLLEPANLILQASEFLSTSLIYNTNVLSSFENFNYSIEQNGLVIVNYNRTKKLSLDTTFCIKKDSCFTLKLKHSAEAPFKNKINFRILNGFDTIYQVNDVYIINDTIKICLNNDKNKLYNLLDDIDYNIHSNSSAALPQSNIWILYNLLGVMVASGSGRFELNNEDRRFETGLYILTNNGVFSKKIFIKKLD